MSGYPPCKRCKQSKELHGPLARFQKGAHVVKPGASTSLANCGEYNKPKRKTVGNEIRAVLEQRDW